MLLLCCDVFLSCYLYNLKLLVGETKKLKLFAIANCNGSPRPQQNDVYMHLKKSIVLLIEHPKNNKIKNQILRKAHSS